MHRKYYRTREIQGNIKQTYSIISTGRIPGKKQIKHQEEFVEINCVGIDSTSSKFNKFNLTEISREYRHYTGDKKNQTLLPEYIRGSEVNLLLGIQNTKIQPNLITICVCKYIWGSQNNICWAPQNIHNRSQTKVHLQSYFHQQRSHRVS